MTKAAPTPSSAGAVVALPAVAEGAEPLGSDLAGPVRICGLPRQRAPRPNRVPCSIVQSELPRSDALGPGRRHDRRLDRDGGRRGARPRRDPPPRRGHRPGRTAPSGRSPATSAPIASRPRSGSRQETRSGSSWARAPRSGCSRPKGQPRNAGSSPLGGAYGAARSGARAQASTRRWRLRAEFIPGESVPLFEAPHRCRGREGAGRAGQGQRGGQDRRAARRAACGLSWSRPTGGSSLDAFDARAAERSASSSRIWSPAASRSSSRPSRTQARPSPKPTSGG